MGEDALAELLAEHAGRHLFYLAFRQFAELKGAERDTNETGDGQPEMAEHVAYFAVLALADGEGEPSVRSLHAIEVASIAP